MREELSLGVGRRFLNVKKSTDRLESDALDSFTLYKLARGERMSVETIMLMKRVFDELDKNDDNTLDAEEFERAVATLLLMQGADPNNCAERVKAVTGWYWFDDAGHTDKIDFKEFVRWYSSNGFNEDLLLSADEREMRRMAKQHGLSVDFVETIKRSFDLYDADGSGEVDRDEFEQVLYKIMKVPPHVNLPKSRIQYFWSEIDSDHSGSATFEEFLLWWMKYFETGTPSFKESLLPLENFYKTVRWVGGRPRPPHI